MSDRNGRTGEIGQKAVRKRLAEQSKGAIWQADGLVCITAPHHTHFPPKSYNLRMTDVKSSPSRF